MQAVIFMEKLQMNILQAGDKAPKFTLQNQADEPVSLSQFAGKKYWFIFIRKLLHPVALRKRADCVTANQNLMSSMWLFSELAPIYRKN